jgi:hypothetical protein
MPGLNGSGPRRVGSMTGGKRGFCTIPPSQATRDQELNYLKSQAQSMRAKLGEIESRINKLSTEQK